MADEDVGEEEIIPITRQQDQPPPPPPTPPQVFELNIVEDDVEIEDQLELDDMEADDDLAMEFVPFEDEEEIDEEEVFIIVEDMPKFKGGDQNTFRAWIQQNLRYPEIAAENGISGRVFVQFDVDKTGKVKNVKIVRGVHKTLDNEALRVVKSSPKWNPGYMDGKPVTVRFTFPIVFQMQ